MVYCTKTDGENRLFDGLMYIVIVVGGALFIKAGRLSAADFMAYLLYATLLNILGSSMVSNLSSLPSIRSICFSVNILHFPFSPTY